MVDAHIGSYGHATLPQFDPELIEVMKKVLEDIMTRVPLEHATPAAKAYFCGVYFESGSSRAKQLRRADRCGS